MRLPLFLLFACGAAVLTTGACHGTDDLGEPPRSLDASLDAPSAPPTDDAAAGDDDGGAAEASDDASLTYAAPDSGPPIDAGTDAPVDAAPDSAAPVDAAPDAFTGPGLPVVLDPAATAVGAIALDATNVYYTTLGGVSGVPRAGGAPFVVAQSIGGYDSISLTLQAGALYWNPAETLRSISTSARNAPSTLVGSFGMSAFDYVLAGGVAYAANSCDSIARLPLGADASSVATTLISEGCNAIPQWIGLVSDPTSGTLDVLDRYELLVDRVSIATAGVTSFSVPANTGTLLIQNGSLYEVAYGTCAAGDGGCTASTLTRSALDGSNPQVVATGDWPTSHAYAGVRGIATSAYVYLLLDQVIERINLATGESHAVYTGASAAAVDGDDLFVVNPAIGLIRVPS